MNKRFNLKEIQPKAHLALRGLEIYLESTSIHPLTKELIKIRASQIMDVHFALTFTPGMPGSWEKLNNAFTC